MNTTMKRVMMILISGLMLGTQFVQAQTVDEERMNRDIAVAENVLSTLIKQEFDKRDFFPVEVRGSYRPGYGVTFSIPTEMLMPMVWGSNDDFVILDGSPGAYSYSFSWSDEDENLPELKRDMERTQRDMEKSQQEMGRAKKEMERADAEMKEAEKRLEKTKTRVGTPAPTPVPAPRGFYRSENTDSARKAGNTKLIAAAKSFITDYGDMVSQLGPNEKIIITNQGENQRWYFRENEKRSLITVEALKSDLSQFRQGKISRDQLLAKVKVTNTESSGKAEPDLELLSSIFNRLYRTDLSKTFFIQGNTYYERLKDYGAVLYMQVYSSNQIGEGMYNMPTASLRGVDQTERDKKVKELYPVFEKELKENILDYGRTVKSLQDSEQLVFNVTLTRCQGCGIPSDIEVSVKGSVLKDYNSGKLDKNSALSKMTIKKGANQ